ncbi:MAG: glycosyl hydrolase family 95 catalytic domain-containing protein, partial [Promethearchaeota archaeon]
PTNKRLRRIQSFKGRHPQLADIVQAIGKTLFKEKHKENVGFESASEDFDDSALIPLYFQFGRYLMISSSRKGSQPINLQGIWNDKVHPPWGSNYTTNINTEMNYWPLEVCNLSECFEPLLTMMKESLHHNSNLWRMTEPSFGSASWAFWPMGGGWLCQNLYEHYAFTQDKDFLQKEAYPLMKGTAIFFLDWLIEKDGYLVTCPSTSPETGFFDNNGRTHNVHYASTCDLTLIRQHFRNTIEAAQTLDIDIEFQELLQEKIIQLYPYHIGKYGHLQEWAEDFEDIELGHRHMSHLIGVHPGSLLTSEKTPELFKAARTSIDRRILYGGGGTGWSCAWKINLFARFKDPKATYNAIATIIRSSTYPNLFDCHPPFQIDGNFGATAGIAECLLQSHEECIELLPAIPNEWKSGYIHGIKSRGNVTVDMDWSEGKLTQAKLHIPYDGEMIVRKNSRTQIECITSEDMEIPIIEFGKNKIRFQVKSSKTYILT